jgi:DNA-binding XRE family transcriptional regulator
LDSSFFFANTLSLAAPAPSLLLAFRIARVFGVPVEEVFQYEFDAR